MGKKEAWKSGVVGFACLGLLFFFIGLVANERALNILIYEVGPSSLLNDTLYFIWIFASSGAYFIVNSLSEMELWQIQNPSK